MPGSPFSIYEAIGGEATIRRLVDRFYARVEADAALRPLFPPDLGPGKEWQYLFLVQVFGGPARYGEARGHPRMRQRHMPFAIDLAARDRWLGHMLASIDEVGIEEPARILMRDYFERASEHMINVRSDDGQDS